MPAPVSKHGTLGEGDVADVKSLDVDRILAHNQSATTSQYFGRAGYLPPAQAEVVDRRFVAVWKLRSDTGEEYVGLTQANSAKLGTFEIPDLVPGEYKISLKLDKQLNANPVTSVTGTVVGGLKSLTVSRDTSSDVLARGMPNHYMDVRITVSTPAYSLLDQHTEMDVGTKNNVVRSFTITEKDIPARLTVRCQSYSIVKRLKLSGELLRCDLAPPKFVPGGGGGVADKAAMGRRLVSNAFSSSQAEPVVPSTARAPPAKSTRLVEIDASVDMRALLEEFYSTNAPDKLADVDKVINHFVSRDGHYGILLATLEDKYKVKFHRDGSYSMA